MIERFRADLARVWPEWNAGARFGVAVSGGPDSLALLLLANAALPGRVVAATVDHGLRPESADEAAFVAGLCRERAIEHVTLRVTVGPGNLQDRARDARYDALCHAFARRGAEAFATAHHADDQAETVLMRLSRGSGLPGLAGIRARRVIVTEAPLGEHLLVRPLLHWRRAELAAIVAGAGIVPVYDPSNTDDRFDRVRMRQLLAGLPDLDPLAIARSADWLQDAEEVVAEQVASVLAMHVFREGDGLWYHGGWPRMVDVEVVGQVLRELGAEPPRSAVAQMVTQLRADGHATLAGIKARRGMHAKDALTRVSGWYFEREGPRRA